jgi:hypothetical protein
VHGRSQGSCGSRELKSRAAGHLHLSRQDALQQQQQQQQKHCDEMLCGWSWICRRTGCL